MDDPRSPNTGYPDADAFDEHWPLTAVQSGIVTLDAWRDRLDYSARLVQECSLTYDPSQGGRFVHLKRFIKKLVPVRFVD